MTLRLYFHPFSSFCQKVLIALYENDTPFEREIVDLGNPAAAAAFRTLWPIGKFPVLRDDSKDQTVPIQHHHRIFGGALSWHLRTRAEGSRSRS